MFIYLSPDHPIRKDEVTAILDIESVTLSVHTRDCLRAQEKKGALITTSYDLPSSMVVTDSATYLSKYTASYLKSKIEQNGL